MQRREEYIVSDPVAVLAAWSAIRDMGVREGISAVLFDGPPGTGKTFLAKHLAQVLAAELMHFQFFEGCSRADMMWEPPPPGSLEPTPGLLLQAVKASQEGPIVLILDEIDKASTDVDAFLLNLIAEGFIFVPALGKIIANPRHLLIAITKNDKRDAIPPLLRRCRVVEMEWPTVAVETEILRRYIPSIGDAAAAAILDIPRKLRVNPEVIKPPSTPEVVRAVRDIIEFSALGVPDVTIGRYFINAMLQNARDRKFIEKTAIFIGMSLRDALQGCEQSKGSGLEDVLKSELAHAVAYRRAKT